MAYPIQNTNSTPPPQAPASDGGFGTTPAPPPAPTTPTPPPTTPAPTNPNAPIGGLRMQQWQSTASDLSRRQSSMSYIRDVLRRQMIAAGVPQEQLEQALTQATQYNMPNQAPAYMQTPPAAPATPAPANPVAPVPRETIATLPNASFSSPQIPVGPQINGSTLPTRTPIGGQYGTAGLPTLGNFQGSTQNPMAPPANYGGANWNTLPMQVSAGSGK